MSKIFDTLFRFLAPPAFLLDIASLLTQINVWLLIGVSMATIGAAIFSMRKNMAETRAKEADKLAKEAEKRYFDMMCEREDCPHHEKKI